MRKYKYSKRRKRSNKKVGIIIASGTVIFLGIIVIITAVITGKPRTPKNEYEHIVESDTTKSEIIETAILQAAQRLGVPENSININEKSSQLTNIQFAVNNILPSEFVNYQIQSAVKNIGGKIHDAKEKGWDIRELQISVGTVNKITHKIKIQRKPRAVLEPAYVSIFIENFGNTSGTLAKKFFTLGIPFTASILPNSQYTKNVMKILEQYPHIERFVNLPMEPMEYPRINPGIGTILVSMSDKEIAQRTIESIEKIPGAVGASNYMGSKATENPRVMYHVLKVLKNSGFIWIDSNPSNINAYAEVSSQIGLKPQTVDIQLDAPKMTQEEIECKLYNWSLNARSQPVVIIKGRASDTLYKILSENIPILQKYGINFICLTKGIERRKNGVERPKDI